MKDSVELKPQEAAYDARKNEAETKTGLDVSKKKQGRARASSTGRGRGSKANNDVTKSQSFAAPVSAQLNVSDHKVLMLLTSYHLTCNTSSYHRGFLYVVILSFIDKTVDMSHEFCVLI